MAGFLNGCLWPDHAQALRIRQSRGRTPLAETPAASALLQIWQPSSFFDPPK
jgi:hypothetical protein